MLHPIVRDLIQRAALYKSRLVNPFWPCVWFENVLVGPVYLTMLHHDDGTQLQTLGNVGFAELDEEFHGVRLKGEKFCMSLRAPEAWQRVYYGCCPTCKRNYFCAAVHPDEDWDLFVQRLDHSSGGGGIEGKHRDDPSSWRDQS